MATASDYIATRISDAPSDGVRATLTTINELYDKKLWHQLTEAIRDAFTCDSVPDKRGLYTSFIKTFESKLNPVSLVQLLTHIVHSELQTSPSDALSFLSPLKTMLAGSAEAHILLHSLLAELSLACTPPAPRDAKEAIEAAKDLIDASDAAPVVHSAFYRASALLHKASGDASAFYRSALQFVAYTDAATLDTQWAIDIALAALTSDQVYNFGEICLPSSTVVTVLSAHTEHSWLLDLLRCFDDGDRARYDELCEIHAAKMNAVQVLVRHADFLKQKIVVLALLRLAFSRALQHDIPYKDIQAACAVDADDVEPLLMRCMALGLIEGVIDNVDQAVAVNKVQARVLDRKPIAAMADRLAVWCANVDKTVAALKQSGAGVIET